MTHSPGRRVGRTLRLATLLVFALAAPAAAQTKLLRFPDIHGDHVVFTYAGDLWTAPSSGGTAVRLTAHPGSRAVRQVLPRRQVDRLHRPVRRRRAGLRDPGDRRRAEAAHVLSRPRGRCRPAGATTTRSTAGLPTASRWSSALSATAGTWATTASTRVPVEGGLPVALPMPQSGAGDLSPDGKQVVYSPLFRDFRAWKRYQGGWAEDLWVFDLATHDAKNITNNVRTDRDPMWIGDRIYFDSDRDRQAQPLLGEAGRHRPGPAHPRARPGTCAGPAPTRPATSSTSSAASCTCFDTQHRRRPQARHLRARRSDGAPGPSTSRWRADIEDAALSPDGNRALFTARGDVFTAPAEYGPTRNLTHSSNAHDKGARWSPDGRKIAFISDMSGEEELYLIDQDGSGEPERLTTNGDQMRFAPSWSPGRQAPGLRRQVRPALDAGGGQQEAHPGGPGLHRQHGRPDAGRRTPGG